MLPLGFPGMPGVPGMPPAMSPGGMDPMALLQMQQAQAQAQHLEMVKQAFADAAANGGPTPTILPPGGLPRPGGGNVGPGMMSSIPGMMGMGGMQGVMGGLPGPPVGSQQSSAAPSSGSSGSVHDGTMEGGAKDFMKRNMLPPSFQEKLVRQLERAGNNWQAELDRLDKELRDAGIPPILRPQFLLVTFGDVVPQTWTDYDEPKVPEKGTKEPIKAREAPAPAHQPRPGGLRERQLAAQAAQRESNRSRSRRRSKSRDREKRGRSRDRRSRSRPKKSRSRSQKRDK